jgi:hypothetical protein
MRTPLRCLVFLGLLAAAVSAFGQIDALESAFRAPPDEARIMMRWWWFGPAVTKPELAREIQVMKAGGIGGFEVQPVYPLALDGEVPGLKNVPFLSADFLGLLQFAAAEAKAQGMRMDLTLGSGWPYGGPMFSIAENSGALRVQTASAPAGAASVPLPELFPGESLLAAFMGPAPGAEAETDNYRDFDQPMEIRGPAAWLPAPVKGPAPVSFFISSHTGMKVKRPAVGAEGYVVDHYDAAAMQKFIREVAAPELAACGPNPPTAVFCDSLENFNTDWTPNLLEEFYQRRGYRLELYLPALITEIGPKTAAIRHDWGRTLTEVFGAHFIAPIQSWAASHGTQFRIQAYGTPPAALFSYADAGLPEGEGGGWKRFAPTRWASSASHLLGKPVTSTETWTWLHSPVFRATPLDMKAAADTYFLQGSNQLIGHGWPYTAAGVGYPGWRFYASAVFDEKNPWWIVMPDVAAYLQRTSFLLRQGAPANDVALYLADDDAWSKFTAGHVEMSATVSGCLGQDVIGAILDSGHSLDFFDDGLLARRGKVDAGRLTFGTLGYRAVVLAGVEQMPLATLRALEAFAQGGGILIATRRLPSVAPGFTATPADQREVKAIVRRLFTAPGAPGIFVPSDDDLAEALNPRLAPDAGFAPAAPDLGFVHRHTPDADLYFLANTSNQPVHTRATFRIAGLQPEYWNLLNGKTESAAVLGRTAESTTVEINLPAYGSQAVVFSSRLPPPSAAVAAAEAAPAPLELTGGWTATFGSGGPTLALASLRSWTENPATRNFSGVAVYERTIDVPAAFLRPGLTVRLDFGPSRPSSSRGTGAAARRFQAQIEAPVREAAVITVNGERIGSVWSPPYAIDLTGRLQAGPNHLRIAVANLAVNEMAAHPLPDYHALVAHYGERFMPQEMNEIAAVPAGLLGPLQLIAEPAAP